MMTRKNLLNFLTLLPILLVMSFGVRLWQTDGHLFDDGDWSKFNLARYLSVAEAQAQTTCTDPTVSPADTNVGKIYYNKADGCKRFRVYTNGGWSDLSGANNLWAQYTTPTGTKDIYNVVGEPATAGQPNTGNVWAGHGVIVGVTQNLGSTTADPNAVTLVVNGSSPQNLVYGLVNDQSDASTYLLRFQKFTAKVGSPGQGGVSDMFSVSTNGEIWADKIHVPSLVESNYICLGGVCRNNWGGGGGPSTKDQLWAVILNSKDINNTNAGKVVVEGDLELPGYSSRIIGAVTMPDDYTATGDINDIWGFRTADSGIEAYAVGNHSSGAENDKFSVNKYAGGVWASEDVYSVGSTADNLNAVWGLSDGSHIFIVGTGGVILELYSGVVGSSWNESHPFSYINYSVAGAKDGSVVYIGASSGHLLKGTRLANSASYTWADLGQVAGSTTAVANVATNDAGTVLWLNQSTSLYRCVNGTNQITNASQCVWQAPPAGLSSYGAINDIWLSPSGELVAATGGSGSVYRKVGSGDMTRTMYESGTCYKIWGDLNTARGDYDFYVSCTLGRLFQSTDNGATFHQFSISLPPTLTGQQLKGLWFANDNDHMGKLFVSSMYNGIIGLLQPKSSDASVYEFVYVPNGFSTKLTAGWMAADMAGIGAVVGNDGKMIMYNGTWATVDRNNFKVSNVIRNLSGVWGTNSASPTVYVVGANGLAKYIDYASTNPAWSDVPNNPFSTTDIVGVWGPGSGSVVYFAGGGDIYKFTPATHAWQLVTVSGSLYSGNVRYITGTENGANYRLYGLTSAKHVITYNSQSNAWANLGSNFSGSFPLGVWASADNTFVYAVFGSGSTTTVYSYNGAVWDSGTTLQMQCDNSSWSHIGGSTNGKLAIVACNNGAYVQWSPASAVTPPSDPSSIYQAGRSRWFSVVGNDANVYILSTSYKVFVQSADSNGSTGNVTLGQGGLRVSQGSVKIDRGDLMAPNNKWGSGATATNDQRINNIISGPLVSSSHYPNPNANPPEAVPGSSLFTCPQGKYVRGVYLDNVTYTIKGVECDSL